MYQVRNAACFAVLVMLCYVIVFCTMVRFMICCTRYITLNATRYLVGYKLDFMLRRAMIRYAMLRYAIATLRYVRCCYAMLRCAAYAKRELCHMCYLHVRYVWYLSISPFGDWKENMPRKK